MAQFWVTLVIVAVLVMSQGAIAKRGCSAFGHSCFGGHGKRSEPPRESSNEILEQKLLGQEETPPHPGYPSSGYRGVLTAGDDIIPVRDGGVYRGEDTRDLIRFKLRSIVKQWMEKNRRSRPLSEDDSYFSDSV